MKKTINFVLVAIFVLLVSGCGKNKEIITSNITSNVNSNASVETSNVTSSINSNVPVETSNVTSNVNSNTPVVTSNVTPSANNQLVCTMDYSSQMGGIGFKSAIATAKVNFANNSASSIDLIMGFDLDDTYASQIDYFVTAMQSSLGSEYANMKGVTISSYKVSATKFEVKIAMDISKMSEEDLKETNFASSKNSDYNTVKASLVASGFTCK